MWKQGRNLKEMGCTATLRELVLRECALGICLQTQAQKHSQKEAYTQV